MLVHGRGKSGHWVMWRVGRQWLPWRPSGFTSSSLWNADFLQFGNVHEVLILPALIVSGIVSAIPLIWYLLKWAVVTAITPIAWSWRASSGRWPVVAYTLGARDDDRQSHRAHRRGRAAAQALVEQWRSDIKEHGHVRVT